MMFWMPRAVLFVMVGAWMAVICSHSLRAQPKDELDALRTEVDRLRDAGKHAEALAAQRTLVTRIEKAEVAETGKPGPNTASALGNLAWRALFVREFVEALAVSERARGIAPSLIIETNRAHALLFLGRIEEARALYFAHKGRRPLRNQETIWEDVIDDDFAALRAAGIEHAAFAEIMKALAIDTGVAKRQLDALTAKIRQLHGEQRFSEAIPLAEQNVGLARRRYGEERLPVGSAIGWLALLYRDQGRYAEAEPLYKQELGIVERALGPGHADVATALDGLGSLYRAMGRIGEAETHHKRSLAIYEAALGSGHIEVAKALNSLATIYWEQGRYAEAEAHLKRSLTIAEKVLGPEHRHVATALNNLAEMYGVQGRPAEAEPLYKRSLAIREKVLGPGHVDVAIPLNNLGSMYWGQGRYAEAEPFMKRGLAIREKVLGANHPDVGQSLSNLAALFNSQRRLAEAEPLLKRSLAIREKALGGEHPSVANSLNNLANLYREMKRYAEAEPLYKRSLAIAKKGLGSDHPHVITVLSGLASLALAQGNLTAAADYLRQAAAIVQRRASRGTSSKAEAAGNGEAQRLSGVFASLVKVTHRLAAAGSAEQQRHATETFEMAQWGQASEAAASLAQMAARSAGGSRELAGLVRERQDLLAEWQTKDKLLAAARGMLPAQRVAATETALIDRLSAIDTRLVEIDARFAKDFPDHAALVSPKPASVKEVQAALAADEALALFLDTNDLLPPFPDETFTWVVTKHDMRLMRSELGMAGLRREVAALRCGLDAALWDDEPAATRCRGLVKGTPQRDASGLIRADTLPFDFARAHALYKNLFGQAEDLIRDKRLLIVPSGALTQLPFQVLLTAEAKDGESAWLARSHTVTVLPAAASLKALRRVVKPSVATRPMIGFGNPLLDGDPASRPWEADWAKKARERQACTDIFAAQQSASTPHHARAAVRGVAVAGRADLEHLRSQPPLFDTADELCAVAKALKVASQDILLGSRATEAGIKRLNAEGRLAQYRVLHFATHGTIAGEIEGTTEPGLILTPPKEQSDMDDGFLSASEVAALKLDADWVILSACNTAAGGANGAEALSGLARAFIYAGARALLVSHWAVDSAATVELITAAVGATARNPRLGRAAAMRSAMLGMIDSGEARKAHPAYWAPFVVVGEGAVPK